MEVGAEVAGGSFVARPRPGLAEVELDGDVVVYHQAANAMHVLNSTAAMIWQCLDGSASVDDLVDEFSAAFATDPEAIRADLVDTITGFAERGLLLLPGEDDDSNEEHSEAPGAEQRPSQAFGSEEPRFLGPAPST